MSILNTSLVLLMNTKWQCEHTEYWENPNRSQKHELVYEIHSNSNKIMRSFKSSTQRALEIAVQSWKMKSFV